MILLVRVVKQNSRVMSYQNVKDVGDWKNKSDIEAVTGKYICRCIERGEDLEEKELPVLPHEERESTLYERQINDLREKLTSAEETIEVEREAHENFMEKSEEWSKRQKQELLDRIKELETEVERLRKQTPQELVNEVESYKEEVARLKSQLEKLNFQQKAQIEVKRWPWSKIRK